MISATPDDIIRRARMTLITIMFVTVCAENILTEKCSDENLSTKFCKTLISHLPGFALPAQTELFFCFRKFPKKFEKKRKLNRRTNQFYYSFLGALIEKVVAKSFWP